MSKDQYYKRLESLFSSSDSVSPEPVNGKTAPAESELAGLRARIAEMEAALAESQRQAAAWQNQLAEARQQAMANQHSDSLRQAETATSINRIAELETALADALKQIRESQQIESQHRAETTALNNRIADLDHMLESARQQMSANEETTALQRAEAATLRDRAAQLEMALADVRQQTPEQQPAESAALKNQIAELEATLAEARQEAAANRQAHTEQHAAVITLNNRVAELEVALNRAQSRPLPSTGRLADGAATLGKVADNIAGMLYQFVLRQDGSAYFPYISSWCYEKFGVTPEEVRENAAPLVAHVHPDDLPNFQASIAHSAQTMQPWLWEGRGVLKDGNVAHMRGNGNPEKMPNGDTLWNGVLVDVTDTKRAAELEETKNFLETLIEVMPVGLFMKDAQDLRFVRWNKGNEDLIGLSRDHVVGKTDFDFFPGEEAEFFQNKDREVLAGGRLVDIPEEPAQTSHRGLRYLHTRKIPVYDAHGQPKYLLGVSEDITERKQAEATLRISEERFSKAFAGVPVAMSINRMSDVRFMEINDRFTAMLGWTPEEAIGRIGSDLKLWVNPEDRVRMYEILHRDGRVRDFPTRFQTKTGEIRDILFSGEIFEAGGEQYLLAMLADVTDRQYFESTLAQRATELEDTTSFLDSVIENLPVMLFVKDAQDLSFVRWNKAGEEITGYSKEAFMGKTDHDFFPKEEADFFAKKDREVLGGGQLVDIPEEPIQTAHRGLRYLHTRKIPIYDADGKPKFLLGISEDITERKQAEEELRKFQHALDRSTDAVFMTDPQGKILYVNPAFEKTYGFTAEEAIGQTPRIIKSGLIPQEQYAQFWNALLNKQVVAGEIVNKAKDGRLIPVEGANTSILDSAGNIIGFMATHRDITERKQAEETL
ncbi:MAG TPA: PAS domain S-box protein, partial [Anaerolineales bacterium]|nr:PAS domain S-box protein [Anaerolineales bacterium]